MTGPRLTLLDRVRLFLKNRKKPILGLLAGAITWVAFKAGFDVDHDLAAAVAFAIFGIVVERSKPIFGEHVETPRARHL
jgi:hypothetical protein